MSRARSKLSQADTDRIFKSAHRAGFHGVRLEVRPDGTIIAEATTRDGNEQPQGNGQGQGDNEWDKI